MKLLKKYGTEEEKKKSTTLIYILFTAYCQRKTQCTLVFKEHIFSIKTTNKKNEIKFKKKIYIYINIKMKNKTI